MATKTIKPDFSKLTAINANGTDLTELWYRKIKNGVTSVATLLWTASAGTITITLSFNAIYIGMQDELQEAWEVPANYTWQDVVDNNLITTTIKYGTNSTTYSLFTIPSFDSKGNEISGTEVIGFGNSNQQYWLACDGYYDMVPASEKLINGATYYLVKRTKNSEQTTYSKLELGDNTITIKGDEPNFYLYCSEAGTYTFTASSSNAFLGYDEEIIDSDGDIQSTTTWVEGTTFSLKADAGKILYVCCSNQDFSNETYILTITKQ